MGVKGGAIKDDADISTLGIKAGQNIMLMGSAESVPEPPARRHRLRRGHAGG